MGELIEQEDSRGSTRPCVIVMLKGDGKEVDEESGELCQGGDGKGVGVVGKVREEDEWQCDGGSDGKSCMLDVEQSLGQRGERSVWLFGESIDFYSCTKSE